MKLLDVMLFVFALMFFVVGVYETIVVGIAQAYFFFMMSLGCLFFYSYRKKRADQSNNSKK